MASQGFKRSIGNSEKIQTKDSALIETSSEKTFGKILYIYENSDVQS